MSLPLMYRKFCEQYHVSDGQSALKGFKAASINSELK